MRYFRTTYCVILVSAVLSQIFSNVAYAQNSTDGANKRNNPLNPAVSFSIRHDFPPGVFDSGVRPNDFLLRPTFLNRPVGLVQVPEILWATVPISARSNPSDGYNTRVGDIARHPQHDFRRIEFEIAISSFSQPRSVFLFSLASAAILSTSATTAFAQPVSLEHAEPFSTTYVQLGIMPGDRSARRQEIAAVNTCWRLDGPFMHSRA